MYHNRYEQDYDMDDMKEQICSDCGCDCDCGCDECPQPQECIGPTGPMGPRGSKGAQGPRGLQGQQGREGLQGLRGPQGITGPQGVPGVQGEKGECGKEGSQGPAGNIGEPGPMGPQGPQGPQGNTGPAGQNAPIIQFASASLTSFTDKTICPGEAVIFDIGNIQCGFTISDDYEGLVAQHQGTYIVEFGCLVSDIPNQGDVLSLEINHEEIIEESRMPILCDNTFVRGTIMLELNAEDSLRIIAETQESLVSCTFESSVNAFLIIYQVR